MTRQTRRDALLLGAMATGAAALPLLPAAAALPSDDRAGVGHSKSRWHAGIEGQRRADLGNGTFLNPVLSGDHPDPSVLKDGTTYYKVSSSFDYYPGLVVWGSEDLVNWTPVGPTLHKPIGNVLAPDLVKHGGRYFIYFAALNVNMENTEALDLTAPRPYGSNPLIANYVIHADKIDGPWSDPIDLGIMQIDPGHGVGEDGKRYLFLADGFRVKLTDDGLKRDGNPQKIYEGWPIPEGLPYETFALEGPKVLRRGDWFYLFAAEGGTAGPPTSHMLVVARSRSINGPWENCPHNPIMRTQSPDEPWWSRGHATPIEGPAGDWWLIYHGYENGFRTLGRQMLLEPMEWTVDGWPRALGGDLSRPMRKPVKAAKGPHGIPFSDDFTSDRIGVSQHFFQPGPDYRSRADIAGGRLRLTATGTKPRDATILVMPSADHRYAMTTEVELGQGASAGLTLFYNKRIFCGLASDGKKLTPYRMGGTTPFLTPPPGVGPKFMLRVVNDANVASFQLSGDGKEWRTICSFEVAGYNHNVFDGFLSLRPAIFAMGSGHVDFGSLQYQAM